MTVENASGNFPTEAMGATPPTSVLAPLDASHSRKVDRITELQDGIGKLLVFDITNLYCRYL